MVFGWEGMKYILLYVSFPWMVLEGLVGGMYPVIGMVGGWPAMQGRYQFEVGLVGWMRRPDVVGAEAW